MIGLTETSQVSVRHFYHLSFQPPEGFELELIINPLVHLVCWTKSLIPTLDDSVPAGDLTPEARGIIEDFVERTFTRHLGKENVLWFKNWASIQSVRSVEHIHVLVRGAGEEFLRTVVGTEANGEITKGIGQLEREREMKEIDE